MSGQYLPSYKFHWPRA